MREIKFRGKIVGSETGIYELDHIFGDLIHEAVTGKTFICDLGLLRNKTLFKDVIIEVEPETVGQYTGLKDRNGKEIYEGDIVKYGKDEPSEVIFKESCFCQYMKYNGHIIRLKIFNDTNKYEIIGNIHEGEK